MTTQNERSFCIKLSSFLLPISFKLFIYFHGWKPRFDALLRPKFRLTYGSSLHNSNYDNLLVIYTARESLCRLCGEAVRLLFNWRREICFPWIAVERYTQHTSEKTASMTVKLRRGDKLKIIAWMRWWIHIIFAADCRVCCDDAKHRSWRAFWVRFIVVELGKKFAMVLCGEKVAEVITLEAVKLAEQGFANHKNVLFENVFALKHSTGGVECMFQWFACT